MPRPISIKDCLKIETAYPDMCNLMRENPEEGRSALAQTKSHTQSLPVGEYRKTYEYLRQVSFGIDPLTRSKEREAQAAESAPPEVLKRIREIQADPAWLNRNLPGHKELHAEWVRLHTETE